MACSFCIGMVVSASADAKTPARPDCLAASPDSAADQASICVCQCSFQKIPGKPRKPLRRTLPRRSQHRPGLQDVRLNDHHLATLPFHQAVLFNVARFPALSSHFRKIFRFFFRKPPDLAAESTPHRCIFEVNTSPFSNR